VSVAPQVKLLRSSGTSTDDQSLHQLLHLVAPNTRSDVIVQLCNYYGSVQQHYQVRTDAIRSVIWLSAICSAWSRQ